MTWKWEELTAHDFPAAVAAAQHTCLLPIGVLEKHGEHLPIGTDILNARVVGELAVAREPAILFPWYFFGQIHEAKQWSGAIALRRSLLFDLLDNTCDEIARNGLHKIILLNGHGGNESFLDAFALFSLEKPRPYTLYIIRIRDYHEHVTSTPAWKAMMQSAFDYHAGEGETSVTMANHPRLVKMQNLPSTPGLAHRRLGALGDMVKTPMFWYADYPDHYAGDASFATVEKGRFLMDGYAARVAEIIKAVKADQATPALLAEYQAHCQH